MAFKLEHLPPAIQKQVLAKIQEEDSRKLQLPKSAQKGTATAFCGDKRTNTRNVPQKRNTPKISRGKAPNKTELEYNMRILANCGHYEAITLRLPGGSRYTADWVTFDGSQVTLHECKGSYRHHSHNRAQTAFREAIAAFPAFKFVWATRQGCGVWDIQEFHSSKTKTEKEK